MSIKLNVQDQKGKWLILMFLLLMAFVFIRAEIAGSLTLASLHEKQTELQMLWQHRPVFFALSYIVIGALLTAVPLPMVALFHLSGGALFGFSWGLLLTLLGANFGALLSFLIARFLLHDFIQARWGKKLEKVNRAVKNEGKYFLVTLRLVPGFPFFITNLAMAMTPMTATVFFFTSFLGSIPITAAVVNTGTHLSEVHSLHDVLAPEVLGSLFILAILSVVLRIYRKKHHIPEVFLEDEK